MQDILVLLLCEQVSNHIISVHEYLEKRIQCKIITENSEIPASFQGLNHLPCNKPIAWENAFYQLFTTRLLSGIKYVYFIEDDVFTKNPETMLGLIKYYQSSKADFISKIIKNRAQYPQWYWWEKDDDIKYFTEPYRSFNPICRLSHCLLDQIAQCRQKNNRFFYNEILFASLAFQSKLLMLDYDKDINSSLYIGDIRWRPAFKLEEIKDDRIYHPVKEQIFPYITADT